MPQTNKSSLMHTRQSLNSFSKQLSSAIIKPGTVDDIYKAITGLCATQEKLLAKHEALNTELKSCINTLSS